MNTYHSCTLYTAATFLVVLGIAFSPSRVLAATYYVDPNGSDTNAGTQSSPWKTVSKAMPQLVAGDTLSLNSGTYTTPVDITKSGTATQPITVRPTTSNVTIDIKQVSNVAFKVSGSYVHVSGITVANSKWAGFQITGSHIVLDGVTATQTKSHGIIISGTDTTVKNSSVYETVNENNPVSESNGWGSGLKVERNAQKILLENNRVYNNYGEGIATTMGASVTIRGNRVYDNYSANIYVDNSSDVLVERNFVTCASDAKATLFYRNGKPASGILMGEESYSGWGAHLSNVTIRNNILSGCKGISFYGAEVSPGGLKGAVIQYNTIHNIHGAGAIYIASEPQNTSIAISYNIAPGTITTRDGITVSNNISSVQFQSAPTSTVDSFRVAPNTTGYGTHGYQFTASTTPQSTAPPTGMTYKPEDLNQNGSVTIDDYTILVSHFGKTGTPGWIRSDIVANGAVDIFDFNALLTAFK